MTDNVDLPATSTERSKPLAVTGRLKMAIELMIWEKHSRDDAAKAAGMAPKSLYNAFRKHHVLAYFRAELRALKESARAKNFHHLEKIAAESGNDMAKVAAIKVMENLTEEEGRGAAGPVTQPGLTIVIQNAPAPQMALRPVDLTLDYDSHALPRAADRLRPQGPYPQKTIENDADVPRKPRG
jgi:hypothetical protein